MSDDAIATNVAGESDAMTAARDYAKRETAVMFRLQPHLKDRNLMEWAACMKHFMAGAAWATEQNAKLVAATIRAEVPERRHGSRSIE